MKNIISSEIYKNIKSGYFKGCFFGGCLLISVVTIFLPELAKTAGFSIKNIEELEISLPFIFVGAAIALIVLMPLFSDIFKYNTYKNVPQDMLKLPKAKFVTVIMFMFIMALVFMCSLTVCIIKLDDGSSIPVKKIIELNVRFLAAIPNYIAIVGFIQLLTVTIKNEIASIVIYYFAITHLFTGKLIVNTVVNENFDMNSHITPLGELFNLGGGVSGVDLMIGIIVGVVYTVVINIFVMKYYKKRVYI